MTFRASLLALALAATAAAAADPVPGTAFADAGLYVIREGELMGLIDRKGKVVLAPEFEELKIGDGLVLARKGYRTAYFDPAGTMVIKPQDRATQPFAEGRVPVPNGKGHGLRRQGAQPR